MISYIVGTPGSGKSYFAVYKIWEIFIKKPKKSLFSSFQKPKVQELKYEYCYTNINKFKYELCDKIKPFDFDEFLFNLEILFNLYKSVDGKDDLILIEKAKELKLFKSLFVLDECHNFFGDKENELLKWWLTYHRHLDHDIYLITQDLSLVSTGYKSIAEFFYKAIPASRRLLLKKFRYQQFTSYKMTQKDLISSMGFHIKMEPEVFNLYHSGGMTSNKSYVLIFLSLFIFICFLVFTGFSVYISNLKSKAGITDVAKNNTNKSSKIQNNETNRPNFLKNDNEKEEKLKTTYIYKIRCNEKDCFINNDKMAYSSKLILNVVNTNFPIFIDVKDLHFNQREFTYIFKEDVFKFLQKGNEKNEDTKNSNSFGSNTGFGAMPTNSN